MDWCVCTKRDVEKDLFRRRNGRRLDMEINDDRRNGETHCRLLALVVSVAVAHPSAHRVEEGEHEEERPPRAHLRRRRRRMRRHLEKTSTASRPPRPRSGSRVRASCRPSSSCSLPSMTEAERGQLCSSALLSLLSPLSVRFAPSSVPLSLPRLPSFSPLVGPALSLVLLPLPPLHFTCFLFRSVLSTLGGARLDCFWAPHTYTLLSLSLAQRLSAAGTE